jgi:hypothetical protein
MVRGGRRERQRRPSTLSGATNALTLSPSLSRGPHVRAPRNPPPREFIGRSCLAPSPRPAIGAEHAKGTAHGRSDTPDYRRVMSDFLKGTGFTFLNKDDRPLHRRFQ